LSRYNLLNDLLRNKVPHIRMRQRGRGPLRSLITVHYRIPHIDRKNAGYANEYSC
jgi:hypothetical protein